jgi:hypothetical protein
MKLPKSLITAILIGIALQPVTSCTKDKELPKPKKEVKKSNPPVSCPACGMG